MAETRLIRRGFVDSDKVNSLSWFAECVYHRLLLVADDYGLFDARLPFLRSQLFGLKLDAVREADLQRALADVERAGLVRFYSVEGKPFLQLLNYGQRTQSKPRFPLPPDAGFTVGHGGSRCATVKHCLDGDGDGVGVDKIRVDQNIDGELSSNVVSGNRAPSAPPPGVPCSPQPDGLRGEEVAPFGAWLRRLQGVVPLLARLNVDRPLPRAVMEAAVAAWRLVPLPDAELEALRVFYAAESVRGYRPDSLEHFFRDLPDVLQHASRFAAAEARRVRKAQAAERARARAVPVVAPDRAPDEVDEQMRYWRSLDGVSDEQRD